MANPTKQEMFDLLFQQFLTINDNREDLIKEATTSDQASQILNAWRQANLNQLNMGNAILDENTQKLAEIVSDAKTAQANMEKALSDLKATATTLDNTISIISKAVSIGTKLVGML